MKDLAIELNNCPNDAVMPKSYLRFCANKHFEKQIIDFFKLHLKIGGATAKGSGYRAGVESG